VATPSRELAIDNIATALSAILTASGYKTNAGNNVNRYITGWFDAEIGTDPWVGFAMIGATRVEHQPAGRMLVTAPFTVIAHTNSLSGATKTADLAAVEDDIIAALMSDVTRNGNAIWTKHLSTNSDEGNPDSDDSRGGSGTIVMTFEMAYRRTTGKT